VRDPTGGRLDLGPETPLWTLLASTGGRATDLFGELDESLLRPLSVVGDEGLVAL
jgi:hypothetical protein